MADAFTPDRSETFSATAQRAALGVLNEALVAASASAVAAVAARSEAGYLNETAHDISALRADRSLLAQRGKMLSDARSLVRTNALEAMADGFKTTAETEAKRWGLVFVFSDADRAALAGHPIIDATADEWADELARRLDWRVRSVATRAALNAITPQAIPGQIRDAGVAWSGEVGRLVGDAWHAGRTAARNAIAQALKK